MSDLLIQIIGTDLSPDEMPTGPCVILTGDERAVAEAAHMWRRRVKLVTGDAADRIAELEAENARLREFVQSEPKRAKDVAYRIILEVVASEEGCDLPTCFILPGQSCLCRDRAAEYAARMMEPLGPDFECVWDENLDALLSNAPLPGKDTP